MFFSSLRRWLTGKSSSRKSMTACPAFFSALWIEPLENRVMPATSIWDGGAVTDSRWSIPTNWVGDVAPNPDDNLVFPASGIQHTNTNDYADGTRFRSITISSNDYAISQDVGAHGILLLEGFVYNATASGASFDVPIALNAAQT